MTEQEKVILKISLDFSLSFLMFDVLSSLAKNRFYQIA